MLSSAVTPAAPTGRCRPAPASPSEPPPPGSPRAKVTPAATAATAMPARTAVRVRRREGAGSVVPASGASCTGLVIVGPTGAAEGSSTGARQRRPPPGPGIRTLFHRRRPGDSRRLPPSHRVRQHPPPVQLDEFLGARLAQPGQPLHRGVVGGHRVSVAVPVQGRRTHVQPLGEHPVTEPRPVLQLAQQRGEIRRRRLFRHRSSTPRVPFHRSRGRPFPRSARCERSSVPEGPWTVAAGTDRTARSGHPSTPLPPTGRAAASSPIR